MKTHERRKVTIGGEEYVDVTGDEKEFAFGYPMFLHNEVWTLLVLAEWGPNSRKTLEERFDQVLDYVIDYVNWRMAQVSNPEDIQDEMTNVDPGERTVLVYMERTKT